MPLSRSCSSFSTIGVLTNLPVCVVGHGLPVVFSAADVLMVQRMRQVRLLFALVACGQIEVLVDDGFKASVAQGIDPQGVAACRF
jgi:hypothetical protein